MSQLADLAKRIRADVFAEKDTISEGYAYAMDIAKHCDVNDRIAVITAIHVLLNSVAKELETMDSHMGGNHD